VEKRYTQQELYGRLLTLRWLLVECMDERLDWDEARWGDEKNANPFEPDDCSPLRLSWKTRAGYECTMTIDPAVGRIVRVPWPVLRDEMYALGTRLAKEYSRPDPYADEAESEDP